MTWDAARLQVVRDYLLENWTPEPPDTLVYLTAETAFSNAGHDDAYPLDSLLRQTVPHYRRRGGAWHPLFTARMRQLLADLGVDIGVMEADTLPNGGYPISQCVLHNFPG